MCLLHTLTHAVPSMHVYGWNGNVFIISQSKKKKNINYHLRLSVSECVRMCMHEYIYLCYGRHHQQALQFIFSKQCKQICCHIYLFRYFYTHMCRTTCTRTHWHIFMNSLICFCAMEKWCANQFRCCCNIHTDVRPHARTHNTAHTHSNLQANRFTVSLSVPKSSKFEI